MSNGNTSNPPPSGKPDATGAPERTPVLPEIRLARIAQAAYFRAEKRGFAPGGEMQDWIEAEAEIDRLLGNK